MRSADSGAGSGYLERLRRGQSKCLAELKAVAAAAGVSSTSRREVVVTEVPWLDVEARTVFGLRALSKYLIK